MIIPAVRKVQLLAWWISRSHTVSFLKITGTYLYKGIHDNTSLVSILQVARCTMYKQILKADVYRWNHRTCLSLYHVVAYVIISNHSIDPENPQKISCHFILYHVNFHLPSRIVRWCPSWWFHWRLPSTPVIASVGLLLACLLCEILELIPKSGGGTFFCWQFSQLIYPSAELKSPLTKQFSNMLSTTWSTNPNSKLGKTLTRFEIRSHFTKKGISLSKRQVIHKSCAPPWNSCRSWSSAEILGWSLVEWNKSSLKLGLHGVQSGPYKFS